MRKRIARLLGLLKKKRDGEPRCAFVWLAKAREVVKRVTGK